MAQKKGGGSTRNGRDSKPKMLGVKVFGGQTVNAGAIIVRQREQRVVDGQVSFATKGALNKHVVQVTPVAA